MMSFRFAIIVCLPSILLAQPTAPSSADAGGPGTHVSREVAARLHAFKAENYARYGDRTLQMDIYRPKSAGDQLLPAIVCIHGGGWWQGNRNNHASLAMALADRGYVTATISYRLSGEQPFPAQIHDCKAAVRFLRSQASRFCIQADRIAAIGLSAGGHLTALLGTSAGVEQLEGEGGHAEFSSRIQAAVPMGAQSDLRVHHEMIESSDPHPQGSKPNIWIQFLGGKPSQKPENWRLASPLIHLDATDPPMLFVTGELDKPTTHANAFRNRMRQLGIAEDLVIIPKAPHAFPGRQVFFDAMLQQVVPWLDRHLKDSSADAQAAGR